jgi:hypothetical protein
MTVSCKFSKRILVVPVKDTFTAVQWGHCLLDRLDIADWGLPKAIISDRDRKFLSEMWNAMFTKLGIKLLYSTAYHPQTDGLSERTNQTVEIALRFLISTMSHPNQWPEALPRLQRGFNNGVHSTGYSPNEIAYGFTPVQVIDVQKAYATAMEAPQSATGTSKPSAITLKDRRLIVRQEASDAIAFAQMHAKHRYDSKHQPLAMKAGDMALIRLHRGHDIPSTSVTGKKFGQQYAGPVKIPEKVGRLAYRLDLPSHWRIHPVLSVRAIAVIQHIHKDGGEQLFRDQVRTLARHQPQGFQGHAPIATNRTVDQT